MVPEHSAILGLPNEMVLPSNATHRGICRFPGKNQDYSLVEFAIREIMAAGPVSTGNRAPGTSENLSASTFSCSTKKNPTQPTTNKRLKPTGAAATVLPVRSRSAHSPGSSHSRNIRSSQPAFPGLPVEIKPRMIALQISGLQKRFRPAAYGKEVPFSSTSVFQATLACRICLGYWQPPYLVRICITTSY